MAFKGRRIWAVGVTQGWVTCLSQFLYLGNLDWEARVAGKVVPAKACRGPLDPIDSAPIELQRPRTRSLRRENGRSHVYTCILLRSINYEGASRYSIGCHVLPNRRVYAQTTILCHSTVYGTYTVSGATGDRSQLPCHSVNFLHDYTKTNVFQLQDEELRIAKCRYSTLCWVVQTCTSDLWYRVGATRRGWWYRIGWTLSIPSHN